MPKNKSKVTPRQLIDSEAEGNQEDGRTILTNEHRISIAQLILENKEIIKGNGKGLQIAADKNRVWKEIYDHAVSLGAVIPNVFHLRKNIFDGMKKAAHRKIAKNKKTGAELTPLTDVDELMLDFEGRESNFMVGLQQPDKAPEFPNQQPDKDPQFPIQEGDDSIDDISVVFRVPLATSSQRSNLSLPGTSTATAVSYQEQIDESQIEIYSLPINNQQQGIGSASDIPLPARPSPRAVANKRKRQTNSKSPDETAIWEDSEYRDLKNDHLRYQVEELKTRIEKNKAATQESNLKGQFWEKAAQAMENNNLVLELRSAVQGNQFAYSEDI